MVPPRPTGSLRSARAWLAGPLAVVDAREHDRLEVISRSQTQSITLRAASPLCIDLNWCANSHAVNTPERRIRPNLSIRRCGADRTSCMNPASRRHLMAEFQNHEFDARMREETATTPRDPERTPRVVVRKGTAPRPNPMDRHGATRAVVSDQEIWPTSGMGPTPTA